MQLKSSLCLVAFFLCAHALPQNQNSDLHYREVSTPVKTLPLRLVSSTSYNFSFSAPMHSQWLHLPEDAESYEGSQPPPCHPSDQRATNNEQGAVVNRVTTNLGSTSNIFKPAFGRWPGTTQPVIIKCLKNPSGYASERDNTMKADSLKVYANPQFIDSGEQLNENCLPTGNKCFVLRDVTAGNPPLFELDAMAKAKGRGAACNAVYDQALPVAQAKVRELGGKGYIHGDLDTTNMFFTGDLKYVEFIDWADLRRGSAAEAELVASTLKVLFAGQKDTNCAKA
ncbi:hypothetical protein DL96DRAFT_1743825 [Flagelloscypha sp. PMI_526]|nr:hypothetical protein DL96DRAFT_1743825 [Flagelloscypha sp. PMI_526]